MGRGRCRLEGQASLKALHGLVELALAELKVSQGHPGCRLLWRLAQGHLVLGEGAIWQSLAAVELGQRQVWATGQRRDRASSQQVPFA